MIARPRKCKVCHTQYIPWSSLQRVCGSIECAREFAKLKREKAERKEYRERKEKLKTRSDYLKEAQIAFNSYIRARDARLPCISCGSYEHGSLFLRGGSFDCGHYRSIGSAPHLRFDERNAHAQCKQCNRYLGGNVVDYRSGLVGRIGLRNLEALEADQGSPKWTSTELIAIRDHYRSKLKELKATHKINLDPADLAAGVARHRAMEEAQAERA